jgi:hypothetical protein
MPITESVIEQVEKMAVKDRASKGLSFKNRKGIEYEFENDEENEMLVEPEVPALYLDIPAKAPGMLTEREEEFGVNDVVQEEMEQTDVEQANLAAKNSGLDFSSVPTKVMDGEVMEILDDEEEDAINEFKQEEISMKVESNQKEEVLQDAVKTAKGEEPRRLAQAQIANRQYEGYELYVTAEEEEIILATVGDKHDEEDNEKEELAAVAHYVMTHYAEKEVIKKKKYKSKSGQYQLEAGIKWFGEPGESAVTKELNQFNKYKVFEPQHANDLSEEDKRITPEAITLALTAAQVLFLSIDLQPTDEDIVRLSDAILPILLKATYNRVNGVHSLWGLIASTNCYLHHYGAAFVCPATHLACYNPAITAEASRVNRVCAKTAWAALHQDYKA